MSSKAVLMISFFMMSALAFPQTDKGTLIVSGKSSLEFVRTSSKYSQYGTPGPSGSSEMNSFEFMPAIGYFIANNFALALSGTYSHSVVNVYKSNELVLMPTIMYYFPLESSFRPYVQAGIGYAKATEKTDFRKDSYSGPAFGGGLGLAYFINENISIDLGVELTRTKLTYSEDSNEKITGDNLGSAIGFTLFF